MASSDLIYMDCMRRTDQKGWENLGAADVLAALSNLTPKATTEICTTFTGGLDLTGDTKWWGGVLAPNGKIYCIPASASAILVIDPVTDSAFLVGDVGETAFKWAGGVLAPNGKIYCIPRNASAILVIDPATNKHSYIGEFEGSAKWTGGVLGLDGKIYGIPTSSTSVLCIDPSDDSTTLFGNASSLAKWAGGCLSLTDGLIYCAPTAESHVGVIDPVNKTITLVSHGLGTGSNKYYGGCYAPDGKIYFSPYNQTTVLNITPGLNAIGTVGETLGSHVGGTVAPNGCMYFMPYSSGTVLRVNPADGSVQQFGEYSTNNQWFGAVLARNGSIYGIPANATSILKLSLVGALNTQNWLPLTHPWINGF